MKVPSSDSLSVLLKTRLDEDFPAASEQAGNQALLSMAAHRSCRRFSDQPVAESLLRLLFGCAMSAPAKSDLQQACIIRVREETMRKTLDDMLSSMPWVADAPELLVVCGDNRRIRRICEMRGKPFGNDHLDSFFNAAVDAGLVLMSLIRAIEALGLGCCPLSQIRNDAARVAQLLGLPEYVFPVAGLVLGHPAAEVSLSPRLPLDVTVHVDRYDDSQLREQIARYDAHRSDVQGQIPAEKQRLKSRYGISQAYGWSEDKARQVSVTERGGFGAFVRGQGFGLE